MLPRRLEVLILIFLGFIVYFNAIFNGFIIGDDEEQLLNHEQVHNLVNIPQFFAGSTYYRQESGKVYGLYYRPLMLSVYSVIYNVFGPDPLVFHVTQIGLHIINAILVLILFSLFLASAWALLGAMIFSVHPMNSEAVLHVANLQDVLFMFFGLLSLIFVRRMTSYQALRLRDYLIVGGLWLGGLFTKETGALFIIIGIWWGGLGKRRIWRQLLLIASIVMIIYLGVRLGIARVGWEEAPISVMTNLPLGERLSHMPILWWNYLSGFLWPDKLSVFQVWMIKGVNWGNFFGPIAGLTVMGLGWWWGRKTVKSEERKIYAWLGVWVMSGLILHGQILPLDATWAERWFYFPGVGVIGILLMILKEVWQRRVGLRTFLLIGLEVWMGVMSARTVRRTLDWRDSMTLLSHDYQIASNNFYVDNLLATLYIRDKKFGEAKPYVIKSLSVDKNFGNLNNAAIIALSEKDYVKSKEYFEETLKLGRQYGVIVNYANALLYIMKDEQAALELIDKYLAEYPKGFDLWLVKAQAEYKLGKYDRALVAAREAYKLKPFDLSEEVLRAIEGRHNIEVEKYLEL